MKNELSRNGCKRGIGSAMRRIALALFSALLVALASVAAATSAGAATKTPFKAHGVFASCGKGEDRTTIYMTFLSLRNERGFDDVKALLRHADEVRPRGAKLRVPGEDRARELRSAGASLPDFLFIDSLKTKGEPPAIGRERATISWRSERTERRQRSMSLHDLGSGFCKPGNARSAGEASVDQERMLGEAAPVPGGGAESTPTEPEDSGAYGRDAAERQPKSVQCPAGTYYGRAADGTEISFFYDGGYGFGQIQAIAEDNGVRYEVHLPNGTATSQFGTFVTWASASQTGFGYSPAAAMQGGCSEHNRFNVTLSDRAGVRTATLSRNMLEPGLYRGNFWETAQWRHRGEIEFRIYPDGERGPYCVFQDVEKCKVDGLYLEGGWGQVRTELGRGLGADRCQIWFTVTRLKIGLRKLLDGSGSCKPGNRVEGQVLARGVDRNDYPLGAGEGRIWDLTWEARKVAD